MTLSLTTPIVLFPALSLILLAYAEKFLRLGLRTRKLKKEYLAHRAPHMLEQIANLRKRLHLIRNLQAFGTGSFFLSICSIFLLFSGHDTIAQYSFWIGMVLMMIALTLAFREVWLSAAALKLALDDVKEEE